MDQRRVAVVVEDDDDIRGLLEAVLQSSGFDVHPASTGVEGVALAQGASPDLVTLDLGLPDIDGFEVARRIRHFSDAHIIMLTARSDEIDTVMGLETGADDYLTKPFSPRELRARVDAVMRRRIRERDKAADFATAANPIVPAAASAAAPSAASATEAAPASAAPQQAPGAVSLELNGLVLEPATHVVRLGDAEPALTPTEFTLLRTVMESGRNIRTKADLVRILRDEDTDSGTFVSAADERTIEVHLGNVRRKLGDDVKAPLWVETVRGVGYRCAKVR